MTLEYWKSEADGQWYWHLQAANGRLVGNGGEGFSRKDSCLRSIRRFRQEVASADVVMVDAPKTKSRR